jgi:tetratricopeptide (TPR) repeat protein
MQYIVTVHAPGFIDVRENIDLLTANTGYLNVELIEDKNSVGADRPGAKPGVINASVPAAAQTEFTRAKTLLAANTPGAADDAIKSLEKAVAIYPKFLEAQIMLGLAYMDLHKWDKAERPLQSAIDINPQASAAYFALGEVYFREKMYPEAERAVQSGLRHEPGAAQGHLTLATIYWVKAPLAKDEQEFRTNAENAWKEVSSAIRIDPKLAEAHLLAGNLLLRARRANDALTEFETYLKLRPDGEFAAETNALVKKIRESIQTGPKQ